MCLFVSSSSTPFFASSFDFMIHTACLVLHRSIHPSRQSILRNQQIVLHTYGLADSHPLLDSNKVSRRVTGPEKHSRACKTTAGFSIFGQRTLAGVILAPRQRPLASSPWSPAAGRLQRRARSTCKVRRAWYCGRHLADETRARRAKQPGPVRNSGRCAGTLNFEASPGHAAPLPRLAAKPRGNLAPAGLFFSSATLPEPEPPGALWGTLNPFQGGVVAV